MQRTFSPKRKGPMITAIMTGETPEELIAQIRGAEFDGADGIGIDLSHLKPEFREVKALERIIGTACLPFMFFFYRNDCWKACPTDESRQEVLLKAAEAGAACIDVMGDLYNPSPRERTYDEAAIAKQKELIAKVHERGAEVVMSSHMSEPLTCAEVLDQLQEFERRGADIVKIVTTVNTEAELQEAIKTTMLLHHELKKPFIHLVNVKYSRFHRFMGPVLGVNVCFAVHRYDLRWPMTQPTVKALRTVVDTMHFQLSDFD